MLLHTMNNFGKPWILRCRRLTLLFGFAVVWLFAAISQAQAQTPPLLVVISVDGMRPDYITEADARGAKVPNLRRFLKEGTYAEGVVGVVPTVTYPSHTTLVTGVWPARHGIFANTTFDPLQQNNQGWYWYTEDIRVPTLWDAAAAAGRTTASIQWPVTVGAPITWNIPEFWRASTPDDAKLLAAICRGEFAINGFRNRDLRPLLFAPTVTDPQELRRQSATVTRKLRLLRGHALIKKVPKTHRYVLTAQGTLIVNALLAAHKVDTQTLTKVAG